METVIGVSLPDQVVPRWYRERMIMEEYAKSKGLTLKVENAEFDPIKQASQVGNLISQDIDVLILVPVDSKSAAELVNKAHRAGIKVVDYDRLIENSDADLYISFNGTRVGQLQGQFLIRKVPRGNYIIMSGDPRNRNSKLYKEGAMEYIQPFIFRKDIKIVTDQVVDKWDPKIAYDIVKNSLIANNNNIDAILAPNDAIAGAAIEALEAQGLAGKVEVTGQDADLEAIQRIVKGTQSMTVFKDYREEAKTAIDVAVKLAKGEAIDINGYVYNGKIDVPSILLEPIAVDKNNIDSVLIKSGYLKKEDVYKTQ